MENNLKLKLRVYINNNKDETFMGIGVMWLLKGINKHGSIRQAASEMEMSYTKAFNILKTLEESLGKKILQRHRGGNSREGTTLTEFGLCFLEKFDAFNTNVESYCNNQFDIFCLELDKK